MKNGNVVGSCGMKVGPDVVRISTHKGGFQNL